MNNSEVLVYGAYGHTGQFVVAQLLRQGLTPILSGRNSHALAELGTEFPSLETRVAAIDDPSGLENAARGTAAVINTAGPFLDTAGPIAEAAVRAGAHYLDVSAEQGSVQELYERHRLGSQNVTTAVVPAMSFYGGLADLLATTAVGDWDSVDEITVGIGLDHWWPTEGTSVTGARNTAPRLTVADSKLVPAPTVAARRSWDFPAPVGSQTVVAQPFSEMITMSKHLRATTMHNFLSEIALADIHDDSTPTPEAVDDVGRSAQQFSVEVVVSKGEQERRVSATGQDIYHITAPLVVEATALLIDGRSHGSGALAPGEAFDAGDVLTALDRDWLQVRTHCDT